MGRSSVLKERIADLPELLSRNIPETRQMLRKMIQGKILCEPVLEHGSSAYRFSATGRMEPCCARQQVPTIVVEGTRFKTYFTPTLRVPLRTHKQAVNR